MDIMRKSKFIFTGIIFKERNGYSGICPEVDIATDGESIEQTKLNLTEAVSLYIEPAVENNIPVLRPIPEDENPMHISPNNMVERIPIKIDFEIHAYA